MPTVPAAATVGLLVALGAMVASVLGRLARRRLPVPRCPACGGPASAAYPRCRHCGSTGGGSMGASGGP